MYTKAIIAGHQVVLIENEIREYYVHYRNKSQRIDQVMKIVQQVLSAVADSINRCAKGITSLLLLGAHRFTLRTID